MKYYWIRANVFRGGDTCEESKIIEGIHPLIYEKNQKEKESVSYYFTLKSWKEIDENTALELKNKDGGKVEKKSANEILYYLRRTYRTIGVSDCEHEIILPVMSDKEAIDMLEKWKQEKI